MSLRYTLKYAAQLRQAVEMRGYVLAVTSPGRRSMGGAPYEKVGRVYRSERDKGKPDRALVTVRSWNRYTVPDVLGQLMETEYTWKMGV